MDEQNENIHKLSVKINPSVIQDVYPNLKHL